MKELAFSIQIHASREVVWKTLWDDATFREWATIIDPGTYRLGDLVEGGEVQFFSAENGYGVTSLVVRCQEPEHLELRHSADTQDTGARSREAQWTGGRERYELTEVQPGITELAVSFDVPEELEALFRRLYPEALGCIQRLAEEATGGYEAPSP